jgi:hypothetical protein
MLHLEHCQLCVVQGECGPPLDELQNKIGARQRNLRSNESCMRLESGFGFRFGFELTCVRAHGVRFVFELRFGFIRAHLGLGLPRGQ